MTTECTEWSQPDGDHFRGLCVNEFEPEVETGGCEVCVSPVRNLVSCCPDCDPQIGFHTELYLRVEQISTYNQCSALSMVGDWVLQKKAPCGPWESEALANGQLLQLVSTSPVLYDDVCYPAGATIPPEVIPATFKPEMPVPKAPKFVAGLGCNGDIWLVANVWRAGIDGGVSRWYLRLPVLPPNAPYGELAGALIKPCANIAGDAFVYGIGSNPFYWVRNFSWQIKTTPFT